VRLKDLTLAEQLVLALSLIFLCMLIVDPLMLEQAKALPQGMRKVFKTITDIGKSNWMLIPTGVAVALALVMRQRYGGWRNAAAYGLIASTIGFVFVSIGGAGLIANLTKNILGRARPKLFETAGPIDFNFFVFDPDYASLPYGHATNIFAFATVICMLWPRGRIFLYTLAAWIAASRVLIGQHYVTDVVLRAILGTVFPIGCATASPRDAGFSSEPRMAVTGCEGSGLSAGSAGRFSGSRRPSLRAARAREPDAKGRSISYIRA
jgi:membrane-associated phospholipid phosphatase